MARTEFNATVRQQAWKRCKGRMFLSMLPAGLSNGGILEVEMDRSGNIALEGIEARFGRVGDGYLISGPKFDAHANSPATV